MSHFERASNQTSNRFIDECRRWMRKHPEIFGVQESANLRAGGGPPPTGGTGTGTSSSGGSGGGSSSSGPATTASPEATGSGTAGIGNLLPWLYPTADFKNVDKGPTSAGGAVALPAVGSWADVLVYSVEQGRCQKITQLGIDYVQNGGAAYVQGAVPAQLLFFIGVNGSPAIAGRPGKPFADYAKFAFLPGAVSAPTPINGLMLRERDELHVAVFNVSIVVTTQSVAARVLAYSFSKKYWSKLMGPQ